ncbi:uncharacterized protein DS421_14g458490 [Arachis hypogaea]|nr:uncharacterized protein DS421_14g458490 [Arachis hypogaea]
MLVRATYYWLNELFTRKSTEAHQRKRAEFTYFEFAIQRIEANMQHAGNIVVHRFDIRNEVFELGNMETWPDYPGSTMVTNPALRITSKGRPKSTRYLKEMDSREMHGTRVCRLYERQGHSRSRCHQRARPSGVGDSGGL